LISALKILLVIIISRFFGPKKFCEFPLRSQFHQHFLRAFFVQKQIEQLFSGDVWLCKFWHRNFVLKTRAKNVDEIDSRPLMSRENGKFRYFASQPEIEFNVDASPPEDEERLEELMEQATQEFRSYLKNQVGSFFQFFSVVSNI